MLKLTATLLVWLAGYPAAGAETVDSPDTRMFSFDAFGTLGVVRSSETRADFSSTRLLPNGAGYTRRWSPDPDSRIGGQVTANLTPRLSAVVQLIIAQTSANTFTPDVEWANVKYDLTPEVSIRVGRILLPSYLLSESRNVGYANPWIRPPVEVYDLEPVSDSDGADVTYKLRMGNFLHTFVGTLGHTQTSLPAGATVNARRLWVMSDTVEYGPATFKITYQQTRVSLNSFSALFNAFRQFGPQGNALADKYDVLDKRATFLGLGTSYDPGKWFVMGEWATTELHSVLGRSHGWYVTTGYRLAKFTPYLTYAAVKAESNTSDPGLSLATLPPSLAGTAAGLNAGLDVALGSIPVQRTASVGARWDFMKNLDLKLQLDHTRLGAGSAGALINVQPDFQRGGTVNLFSVTIDFVL
jgi:hypothetical protein